MFYEISIKFLCEATSFCLDPMSNFFAFEINRMEMCGIVLPLSIQDTPNLEWERESKQVFMNYDYLLLVTATFML